MINRVDKDQKSLTPSEQKHAVAKIRNNSDLAEAMVRNASHAFFTALELIPASCPEVKGGRAQIRDGLNSLIAEFNLLNYVATETMLLNLKS